MLPLRSITSRITAASILLVLCGIAFAIVGASWILYDRSADEYEARLNRQLSSLSAALVQPLWAFDSQSIESICSAFGSHNDVARVRVVGDNREQLLCDIERNTTINTIYGTRDVIYQGRLLGTVEIGISMSTLRNTLESLILFGLISALLVSVFVSVGIRRLLHVFLRTPLTTLSNWAGDMAQGQYSALSGKVSEVELRELAERFQDMAEIIALREMELRKLSMATDQSPAAVVITDPDGRIEYVNKAFEQITGYNGEEVRGLIASPMKTGDLPENDQISLWETIRAGNAWQGEFVNTTKDGQVIWEQTRIAPIVGTDGNIRHFVAVREDVTLHKQQEEQILHQAHYDSLTNLPNRLLCIDRLGQHINEARRRGTHLAVMFLDMDDFKKVNDTMGHDIGDELLLQVATRLSSAVREEDTVGRLGGDEFIILAGELAAPEDAGSLAEHLMEQFRTPFDLMDREVLMTASIGIACFPHDGNTTAELLRNADTAMYYSKKQGRNTFHYFDASMNLHAFRRLQVEERLQRAMDQRTLDVYYQPIVEVPTRRWCGAEALLRWNDHELGPISPTEFVPIAEQNSLIVPIGMQVVRQATTATREWQRSYGLDFAVSVNVSPRQFRELNLAESVALSLKESGLAGTALTMEITEGVVISGHPGTDHALRELSALGVGIAMDDFGTGYSSLSYLRSYPFTSLKIDRTFVHDLTLNPAGRELVSVAIQMGHALGMKVVAEGVETEEQLAILAELGCDFAQGFLFSEAIPRETFTELLVTQAVR